MSSFDPVPGLREALKITPNNIALRQHLAEMLLNSGREAEAEVEFKEALSLAPNSDSLRLGLARSFQRQKKMSHALALLENMTARPNCPGEAHQILSELLTQTGEVEQGIQHYRRAVEKDPKLADKPFETKFGLEARRQDDSAEVVEGKLRQADHENLDLPAEIEKPKINFEDVGGMDAVKEEIRLKIIYPLTHAETYKAYGKKTGGGILLYGPPGCGKTYLARATAGEIKSNFISVGIHDVLEMWIGNSERNLHGFFEQARSNTPCVIFFDEVDALGASRADLRQHAGRQLINQFLSELDGVQASNEGVLILAATNAPWHLDPAFRRPGRFDRLLFVPPPDTAARASILKILSRNKPMEEIDFLAVAKKTESFSGADLQAVMDLAVEARLTEALKSGKNKPVTTKDMLSAAANLKPTTAEWFASARNYALYSNQGGIYDDILKFLKLKK